MDDRGLAGGRWALLTKVHHSVVDGVAGAELLSVILDEEREPHLSEPAEWRPERQPSGGARWKALLERAISPYGLVRGGGRALAEAGRGDGRRQRHGPAEHERHPAPHPVVTQRPGRAASPLGLGAFAAVRRQARTHAFAGTVNDVVLTAIAGGFRELLAARGEPADRDVRSLVPVSVRSAEERGRYNNRVSAIFADLPVGVEDPVERLARMHGEMEHLRSHEAVAGDVLVGLSGFPALLLALGLRTATRVPQHSVNTVTTNVPGPQHFYAAGRRMLECFLYVPLGGRAGGRGHLLLRRRLGFGVTGDYDRAPDIHVLCEGIEHSMAELVAAAEAKQDLSRAPRPRRPRRLTTDGPRRPPRPLRDQDPVVDTCRPLRRHSAVAASLMRC